MGTTRPGRGLGLMLAVLVFSLGAAEVWAQEAIAIAPVTRNGEPWRMGYIEGGHYNDYPPILKSIIQHLSDLGWVPAYIPGLLADTGTNREIWEVLAREAKGPYLRFEPDAFWSADWEPGRREANREAFLSRVNQRRDLDLMIAMGTWAGQDLANNRHHVPTLVCSTSNPVAAGIIRSVEDSGFDHVHARIDPQRYARQVHLFHDVVQFKRLGLVYEDTVEGRTYAGLEQIEPLTLKMGFQIVSCQAPFAGVPLEEAERLVVDCYERLAPQVDAMYITIHRGVNERNMKRILSPLFRHRVPNFAMGTLYEVRYGAMMSMAQPDFDHAGAFYARVAAQIFNGASPRKISQTLEDPHRIIVNIEAAKRIGFDFPMDILGGADEIVDAIQSE
jgi:ABC-type uncharacterized transport system substrate-binding protein